MLVVEPSADPVEEECKELCIHPSPTTHRDSIFGNIKVDERLDRAYKTALDAFNAGIWAAAVTSCRRTLEGIVKVQLPESERKGMLAQQLKQLPKHVDLSQPLLQLADVLKDGGNIGAHFDLEKEPDMEFATLMIDLTEYLIEYICNTKAF